MQDTRAQVYAPEELTGSEKSSIEKSVQKKLGAVKCEFLVDESIKGGLRVVYGSQVLDLTLEGILDSMRRKETYEE